jgi:hypothetical protein
VLWEDAMQEVLPWLLEGPPWVVYRTRRDLLEQPEDDPRVQEARQAMRQDPQVQELLAALAAWPGRVLNSHKSADHPLHQLVFLADLGLRAGDPGVGQILERILEHQSSQGPFQVLINVPKHFGGTGEDGWGWALCDAPLLLYVLVRFGLEQDPRVQAGVQFLAGLVRENGWPCAVSPELGRFRGPRRKDDPCPYANLVMLQLLAQLPEWRDSLPARVGAETALSLWTTSRESHPYMFYMGTDFRKLKAPLVWYDILHVLDVLTHFPWLAPDPRLQEMMGVVTARADALGRYTPESVWKSWSAWARKKSLLVGSRCWCSA